MARPHAGGHLAPARAPSGRVVPLHLPPGRAGCGQGRGRSVETWRCGHRQADPRLDTRPAGPSRPTTAPLPAGESPRPGLPQSRREEPAPDRARRPEWKAGDGNGLAAGPTRRVPPRTPRLAPPTAEPPFQPARPDPLSARRPQLQPTHYLQLARLHQDLPEPLPPGIDQPDPNDRNRRDR